MATSALNPDVVKTALDAVFYQEFDFLATPQYATAESPCFMQDTIDRAAVITEVFKDSGYWENRAEQQNVPEGESRVANKVTYNVANFARAERISKNFFDDKMIVVVK